MTQVGVRNNGVTMDIYNYTNGVFSGNAGLIAELGIPFLDKDAHETYERLGIDVVTMPSSQGFLCYLGGTRCLSEVQRH